MSMQDTRGLEGDSKNTQRVSLLMHATMASAVAAALIETVTPASESRKGFVVVKIRVTAGVQTSARQVSSCKAVNSAINFTAEDGVIAMLQYRQRS